MNIIAAVGAYCVCVGRRLCTWHVLAVKIRCLYLYLYLRVCVLDTSLRISQDIALRPPEPYISDVSFQWKGLGNINPGDLDSSEIWDRSFWNSFKNTTGQDHPTFQIWLRPDEGRGGCEYPVGYIIGFYRAMLCRARLCHSKSSVRLSVSLSLTFRYVFHTGLNTSKITSRLISLRFMLGLTRTWAIWSNGNNHKIRVE